MGIDARDGRARGRGRVIDDAIDALDGWEGERPCAVGDRTRHGRRLDRACRSRFVPDHDARVGSLDVSLLARVSLIIMKFQVQSFHRFPP